MPIPLVRRGGHASRPAGTPEAGAEADPPRPGVAGSPTGDEPTPDATTGRDDDEVVDVVTRPRPTRDAAERDAQFTAFMAEHGATLLHTAWLLAGDAHRAEELTQQALVRTYAAWARVAGDPLAYARRVLVNLRVDTWRRRRREVLTDEVPENAGPADPHRTTHDRDQLVRALALLTPSQRRIVVLRHLVGLPEAEVAAELGVSLGTVKSAASRGLVRLRELLADEGGDR
jgi:RNA polymerase sigma-70 factor (sigma-E family)